LAAAALEMAMVTEQTDKRLYLPPIVLARLQEELLQQEAVAVLAVAPVQIKRGMLEALAVAGKILVPRLELVVLEFLDKVMQAVLQLHLIHVLAAVVRAQLLLALTVMVGQVLQVQ
jgi:hypothetical protein